MTYHKTQAECHAFNVHIAEKYGVYEAIIISHFQFWINNNIRNKRNEHDGRTWTYQTRQEIANWFPYLSIDQVRRLTDSLVEKNVLIKGNYNKTSFDKTIWYAFNDEYAFTCKTKDESKNPYERQNCQMDLDNLPNQFDESAKPIPDTNPDAKTIVCNPSGSSSETYQSLDKLNLTERQKKKFSSSMDEAKVNEAVRRVLSWKDRSSDIIAFNTVLRDWDVWHTMIAKKKRSNSNEHKHCNKRVSSINSSDKEDPLAIGGAYAEFFKEFGYV